MYSTGAELIRGVILVRMLVNPIALASIAIATVIPIVAAIVVIIASIRRFLTKGNKPTIELTKQLNKLEKAAENIEKDSSATMESQLSGLKNMLDKVFQDKLTKSVDSGNNTQKFTGRIKSPKPK
ncbi:hypothetical protein [Rickettsiales endosymbiont of Stachyamoeba lipophora]|uniref:hypothetical protein n=1 Tax=Rickettsiales endosymbiont of Stachyamoeba lipophora TaxID=2486578 RepID=UPI000F649D71|nr:hypothetical protein [Rickettsiales endosymbiont of Stachyamoeba lipophora]AZL15316.1 hypothetical protein EF513_01930 [Rickettsiales endosymbiont of Stachyamoeba lipophora]